MDTIKLGMIASALLALVGCADTGNNMAATKSSDTTTAQSTAPVRNPPPPAAYKPYICTQGGDHNC
ncbi:MAG: hypothetical protein JWL84_95 [Rhodospirillales bacterium]|jgi:hypothetical protein|nr:hypothetical protein [Rhodospirillales bacterium]